jgi:hypothetical protein
MTSALRKYLDAVLLVAILPVALVLGWQVWEAIRTDQDRMSDELAQSASAFAQSVNRELASSIEALRVLSQSEIFQQGRIAAMGRLLHGRPRRDWDSIFLLDANGAVVLDTATKGSSLPPAAMRTLYAQALLEPGAVVSGATSSPGIAIATPILQAGHVRYVLGVRTSDSVWTRLAANAALPQDGQARLYDAQGRSITAAASGTDEGEETYEAWSPVPIAAWRARVSVPAAPIEAAHRKMIVAALSTSGASLALGFVLAAVFARRIARRIDDQARAKDEQFDQLIHGMRNALNALSTATDVLASADPASETAAEAREIVRRQTRALSNLLHERRPDAP